MGKSRNHEFDELYGGHAARVLAACRRLLGPGTGAEDAAHETFLRAGRGFESYEPQRPFAPWVLRIAANVCLDELRRRKRDAQLFAPIDADREDRELADGGGGGASPLSQALAAEERELLRRALDALPERERALMTLRYEAEMSYDEIGRAVSLTPANVGVIIHRVKLRLRAALGEALGRR